MDWLLNNSSLALVILAVVLILFGALLGLLRGFKRAFIRFLTVMVAFFGSIFVCKYFLSHTKTVMEYSWMKQLLEMTGLDEYVAKMETDLPQVYELLIGLPVAVLAPIVFTVLFLVAAFVLGIVSIIVGFFAGKRNGRLIGAVIGAVQGVVFLVAITVPLCGLLNNAVTAIKTVEAEGDPNSEAVVELAETREKMEAVTDAPIYKLVSKIDSPVCDGLMRYKIDGGYISVRKESENVSRLFAHILILNTDIKKYDQTQITAMNSMVDDIEQSTLMKRLITGILNAAGDAWSRDATFFDQKAPTSEIPKEYQKALKELYKVWSTTSEDPVSDAAGAKSVIATDLQTLVDLMDVLEKHGIFPIIDNGDALEDKFANDPTLVSDVRNALRSNSRYDAVCDALEEAAFQAVVTSFIKVPEKPVDGEPQSQQYIEYHEMTTQAAEALNQASAEDVQAFLDDPEKFIGENVEQALIDFFMNDDGKVDDDGELTPTVNALIDVAKDLIAEKVAEDEDLRNKIANQEIDADDIENFLSQIKAGTGN